MELSKENQLYSKQMGLVGVLYDCGPRGFGDEITNEEKKALDIYYFAGREVDVNDMFKYREQLAANNPELVMLAKNALRKVAAKYRVDEDEVNRLLQ